MGSLQGYRKIKSNCIGKKQNKKILHYPLHIAHAQEIINGEDNTDDGNNVCH